MPQNPTLSKYSLVFVVILLSGIFAFAFNEINKRLSCDTFSTRPGTYSEAFKRADDYYSKGEKREFLSLYLWQSDEAKRCYTLAVDSYSRALRMEPHHADALANRASTYLSLEDYDKALADYRAVLELNPQDHHARLGIALAYEKSGQLESAVIAYQKAIEFMEASSYWTSFHPDSIEEYRTKLKNLQELIQRQTSD